MTASAKSKKPVVALIMGSKSDLDVVKGALTVFDKLLCKVNLTSLI